MLYEEKEKKRLRGYAVFADIHQQSPYLEWLWSDKWAICWLKIS